MSSEELLEVGLMLWRPADAGCQEIGEELGVDFVTLEQVVSSEDAVACLELDARQELLEAACRVTVSVVLKEQMAELVEDALQTMQR
jgi:hypothetical protein